MLYRRARVSRETKKKKVNGPLTKPKMGIKREGNCAQTHSDVKIKTGKRKGPAHVAGGRSMWGRDRTKGKGKRKGDSECI